MGACTTVVLVVSLVFSLQPGESACAQPQAGTATRSWGEQLTTGDARFHVFTECNNAGVAEALGVGDRQRLGEGIRNFVLATGGIDGGGTGGGRGDFSKIFRTIAMELAAVQALDRKEFFEASTSPVSSVMCILTWRPDMTVPTACRQPNSTSACASA